MKNKETFSFDLTSRTERYFASTILPIFLTANGNKGIKNLFKEFYPNVHDSDEIELVTEPNPLRDGRLISPEVKEKYKKNENIAIPDLFLKMGDKILIIEAKFFTFPDEEELEKQIKQQKETFNEVKKHTLYGEQAEPKYLGIGINEVSPKDFYSYLTWRELLNIIYKDNKLDDYKYFKNIIEDAIIRAEDELSRKSGKNKRKKIEFETVSFQMLINNSSTYLNEGKIFVGYVEGRAELKIKTLEELKKRDYKVSKVKWSKNWILLTEILERYIKVKFLQNDLDDIT